MFISIPLRPIKTLPALLAQTTTRAVYWAVKNWLRFSKDGDTVAIIGNPVSESTLDRENGALEALKVQTKVMSDTTIYDANTAFRRLWNLF